MWGLGTIMRVGENILIFDYGLMTYRELDRYDLDIQITKCRKHIPITKLKFHKCLVNDMYIEEIIRETRMGLQNSPKKHDSQSNENGYRRGAEQVEDNITLIDPSIPPGFEEHITKIKTQREVKTLVARKTDPMSLVALLELEDPKETPERRWLQILHMPCMIPLKKYLSAAVEISCEPSIGKHVRTHSLDHAAVSTVLLLMEIQQ
ncbi:hypothetical protein Ahy_B06g083665 isoform A [Arachis hypogaea]|uniref:Uncharacterized protein n=1 Tax=Arachis hypogaea TaxID=3818 RepID=A0A444YQ45_ARAHY|nr:hypothetical protein Ahy_B06g083665 isoform A [Arachis hypogaea]